MFCQIGRCRSGRRWFWVAEEQTYDMPYEQWRCVYGWEDTKELAIDAARMAAKNLGATEDLACWEYVARTRLKQINKAKRGDTRHKTNNEPAEYLFSRVGYTSDMTSEYHSWMLAFPIVKKTKTRIRVRAPHHDHDPSLLSLRRCRRDRHSDRTGRAVVLHCTRTLDLYRMRA